VEYIHDREKLQLGTAGASLALLSFRPRWYRLVVEHIDDTVSPVIPIAAPRPGLRRQLLHAPPHVRQLSQHDRLPCR